jgi:Flp pilus assembly secretin CpaC
MRKLVPAHILGALGFAAALAASSPVLAQSSLTVEIDHAARIQLRGAASSVIVGNPDIADVTVVDASTLFITGKGYGSTQVVVVDGIGRTLYQADVVVTAPRSGQVRVWRGGAMQEMACGASCAPSIRSSAPAPSGN